MERENHFYGNRDEYLVHLGCGKTFEVYFFAFK